MCYVEGSMGSVQAFCSAVRCLIKIYSKVTSDFASSAEETTVLIELIVDLVHQHSGETFAADGVKRSTGSTASE